MTDEELKEKKEGRYTTGLPLVNYSTDDGIGFGARVYFYYNGYRDNPSFAKTPYLFEAYAQFFETTTGLKSHELSIDVPRILSSPFSISGMLLLDEDKNANFFGFGKETTRNKLSANGKIYETYEQYEREFLHANNYESYKYNKYKYTKPTAALHLFFNATDEFRLMTGFSMERVMIDSWYLDSFKVHGSKYRELQPTLLDIRKPRGYEGGHVNALKLGLAYDSRDYEPDPHRGWYLDATFIWSDDRFDSDFNYYKATAAVRRYLKLTGTLTAALRLAYTDSSNTTPFFEANGFDFLDDRQEGLGGNRTLRGFQKDRFVGNTMTMGNAELRWDFARLSVWDEKFAFKLIAFMESGNVYNRTSEPFEQPAWKYYKHSYGGGFVVAWNMATIIHLYAGFSREDYGVFLNFNHNW